MIENERFMLDDAGEVIDLQTAKFIEYGEEIVECLNNLHEENQALKSSNMEYEDALGRLEEENEQLKGEVAYYKLMLMSLEEEAKRISKIRSGI